MPEPRRKEGKKNKEAEEKKTRARGKEKRSRMGIR